MERLLRSAALTGDLLDILVVDDDLELATMLSRYFERHGFTVRVEEDALRALDWLRQGTPAFIIADLMMPHMDGLQFVEALKRDERLAPIPVVLLTAYPDEEIFDKGLRKGAAFALPKPVDFDRLLTLVRFAM